MTISVNLNEAQALLVTKYAELNGVSIPELIKNSIMDHIEDAEDLKLYEMAMAEYEARPVTFTLDEVESEIAK